VLGFGNLNNVFTGLTQQSTLMYQKRHYLNYQNLIQRHVQVPFLSISFIGIHILQILA